MTAPEAGAADTDTDMMRRCLALAQTSGAQGEYPYAAVICRNGAFVCESTNRVGHDRDVTRHAEVVALSEAQRLLGRTSLDECVLYAIAEPCAYCSYAIRETRIVRVVYGLRSPVMGGHTRWNVLADTGLSAAMPEVFAPPPEIVSGYLAREAEDVFDRWNPLIWHFIKERGIFTAAAATTENPSADRTGLTGVPQRLRRALRWLIDRIGRR